MEVVMEITRGNITAIEGLSTLDRVYGISYFSKMHPMEAISFLSTIIRECFQISAPVRSHLKEAFTDPLSGRTDFLSEKSFFQDMKVVKHPGGITELIPIEPIEAPVENPLKFNFRNATDLIWQETAILDYFDVGWAA